MQHVQTAKVSGKKLKDARESVGLTQQQVADRIGVKVQTISNYENDHGKPSANVFVRMCMLYNLDARHLVNN